MPKNNSIIPQSQVNSSQVNLKQQVEHIDYSLNRFEESKMLKTMEEKDFVKSIIPRLTPLTRIKLLYRLGEEDKFDLDDYKSKVHDKGATVVLVKSSVDEIAGGFTSIPW